MQVSTSQISNAANSAYILWDGRMLVLATQQAGPSGIHGMKLGILGSNIARLHTLKSRADLLPAWVADQLTKLSTDSSGVSGDVAALTYLGSEVQIPFDRDSEQLLTAMGFTQARHSATWEDIGTAESGPKLWGHDSYDEWSRGDLSLYVQHGLIQSVELTHYGIPD